MDSDNGRASSGPQNKAAESSLAILSAISLPGIPEKCSGTHDTPFSVESVFKASQHYSTIVVDILSEEKTIKAILEVLLPDIC